MLDHGSASYMQAGLIITSRKCRGCRLTWTLKMPTIPLPPVLVFHTCTPCPAQRRGAPVKLPAHREVA